ncbi:hypothetical protein UFOVP1367_19 [uncultured Caudovirales phage]|uniref:Uncharacterized protein n=1 Tax=uncultured Caudovirales phage TaxID=2100421 RepID=A0A6J5S4X5_9CAUD|nr:hypothetical protein KNT69_gp19 [uncultured Caudovirales phage]CAB4202495.1 hypothetical protein UFOVP1367_19 [uncultured Caudovirales phage]
MSLTLDAIDLPPDLLWVDEFEWTPIEQSHQHTLTGALVFQSATRAAGRPITLSGSQDHGWATKTQVDALYTKLTGNAVMTLTLPDARTFQVRFLHENNPLTVKPIVDYRIKAAGDFFEVSIKLIAV